MSSKLKVLYFDDEEDILKIAKMSVEFQGKMEMEISTDAQNACQVVKNSNPDLIMLDMMMPKIDGLTVLRNLQSDELISSIPVVFVTAKVQSGDLLTYMSNGAIGVITKPFDPMTLSNELEKLYFADRDEIQANNELQNSLNSIKRTYVESMDERIEVLQKLKIACSNKTIDELDMTDVVSCVHKLAGSGTTFGFPNISKFAHELESLFTEAVNPCNPRVQELAENLISACNEAKVSN